MLRVGETFSEDRASGLERRLPGCSAHWVGDITRPLLVGWVFSPTSGFEGEATQAGLVFALPRPMRKYQRVIFGLLALLASVPFFVQADRAEAQRPPVLEPAFETPRMDAPLAVFSALPAREGMPELRGDPFSRERQERRASASRPTPRAVPAAVEAPPNPYRFAGEVRQSGSARRFLVRGNDILEVSEGDVLSDGYRVETVTANEVVLLHLGTGLRQTLAQTRT